MSVQDQQCPGWSQCAQYYICSHLATVQFWIYFLFSGYIEIMLWKSKQTMTTIKFKYKRICLTWKEKNNCTKKDLCNSEFIEHLNENWFLCLFGQSKTFQKIKDNSNAWWLCFGGGDLESKILQNDFLLIINKPNRRSLFWKYVTADIRMLEYF